MLYQASIHLRQRWRVALQSGSLILLLAFLPTAAYVGHWGEFTDYALGQAGHERPAPDHASHDGHCHGPSECADKATPVGVKVFATVVELPPPPLVDHVVEEEILVVGEYVFLPPTEPPRL